MCQFESSQATKRCLQANSMSVCFSKAESSYCRESGDFQLAKLEYRILSTRKSNHKMDKA